MKKSGLSEEQIIGFLRQAEAGQAIRQWQEQAGLSDQNRLATRANA